MRASALTPDYAPLPFGRVPDSTDPGARISIPSDAIAQFDAVLHELNPDAPRVDQARLQALAGWLMRLSPQEAHDVLELRLTRIEQLRALLVDPDWDADAAMRARLGKLLSYFDRAEDLIADSTPALGLLDDVLMFELAWPVFEAEAVEYGDFCDYRASEHPGGDAPAQRAAWLNDRLAELALLRHHARVHDSHYADVHVPDTTFRVVW
ncbi:hypothetical protein [Montanilutibacter psychrotolerans]|uniref:DUF1232 domain-containing protein n=1 Tax=Montanilutibacter psychrotolerans TaxID=1327343 RepID=A0A3M8T079_9GAMM|nr:hypothetical protein [Lysobacter psychrotolerans]RNF86365.1 hypothetical protein EER27_02810 [Lysobacter psychrotolerans]